MEWIRHYNIKRLIVKRAHIGGRMKYERLLTACEKLAQLRRNKQRQLLTAAGLHIGQPAMLEFVRSHPGCTQKEMADQACVTAASIAASFKRLENAGFISRRVDTSDTRCNRVYITEAGERALNNCMQHCTSLDSIMLEGISDEDAGILQKCIEQMIANIQELTEK